MKYRFEKLFAREEANELIPRLEALVGGLQLHVGLLRQRIVALASAEPEREILNMELREIIELYPELGKITDRMAELAGEIDELGCFLKDVDLGLVDFPSEMDEEIVFLCWQPGEPQIVAWHSIEGGFAGRQPLSGTPKRYLN